MGEDNRVHSKDKSGSNFKAASQALARFEEILTRIGGASTRAGRDPEEVLLIGAAKTVPPSTLQVFLEAGLQHCGENYVQEGMTKIGVLRPLFPHVQWHLIGALQSNKAREAVAHFDTIHSVDRISLINALDKAAAAQNKVQKILLQVNLGGEDTKAGCAVQELSTLAGTCREKSNLQLCGLMCLPPFHDDPEKMRPYFRELRRLRDKSLGQSTLQLSMGMSNDFEVAVEEGATMIRVGTALFGARL